MAEFLDYDQFRHIVNKYKGNHYVKHFTCWNQLLTLMFGQLSNRETLRDLIIAIEAHYQKCYHLGLGKHVTRSNLAKANTNRDYRIFEELPIRRSGDFPWIVPTAPIYAHFGNRHPHRCKNPLFRVDGECLLFF